MVKFSVNILACVDLINKNVKTDVSKIPKSAISNSSMRCGTHVH